MNTIESYSAAAEHMELKHISKTDSVCRQTNFNAPRARAPYLFILFLSLTLLACKSQPQKEGKRYELKGTVLSVNKPHGSATIAHEEIKDFMEAMTMDYAIKDTWALDVMKPGDQIHATLVVTDSSSRLEEVVVVQKSSAQSTPATETSSLPKPGDSVPDFRLINQDGKPVRLSQFRGRALLLTFIYTRCPDPLYCTLMSNNFSVIDQELSKDAALKAQTHLLSVSFDPAYDTPQVLRSYGASHTGGYDKETFAHWEFATGEEKELKRMAQYFGLAIDPQSEKIVHSLQTALVGPDGKLAKLYSGNEWKPSTVIADILSTINRPQ